MHNFFTALYKSRFKKRIMTSNTAEQQEDNTICRRTTLFTGEKEIIVSLFREDNGIVSIFRITGLGYRTVQTVVSQYITTRRISVKTRGRKAGCTPMTDDIIEFVGNEIRLECTVTLKVLQSQIFV
ncbi:hypothetical protein CDIK_2236 [Cucumispora dikerogammari]|nr:hypothetical protein CDIK_2236 [Cucumispora dikerogammari]